MQRAEAGLVEWVDALLSGGVAVWRCGCVVVWRWLCGCVAVGLYDKEQGNRRTRGEGGQRRRREERQTLFTSWTQMLKAAYEEVSV